ncbi:MAG: cob(I)yrinic acid a,c-diamide adenosyltransferase [Tannerella sp.]|nr:cob(I)yrinic acid a,c-diamide adenosyltransferase [Tannerella sp.]
MKKSILYTRGGDGGTTSLAGGTRVAKTHLRIEAYGAIDELNSFIGLLVASISDEYTIETLQAVQHRLFDVGAYLADARQNAGCNISAETVEQIEKVIDLIDSELPRLKGFILPGGCQTAALAHVCRTVCRRAEREIIRLSETISVDAQLLKYVNRLSDLLFAIARRECMLKNKSEFLWENACI